MHRIPAGGHGARGHTVGGHGAARHGRRGARRGRHGLRRECGGHRRPLHLIHQPLRELDPPVRALPPAGGGRAEGLHAPGEDVERGPGQDLGPRRQRRPGPVPAQQGARQGQLLGCGGGLFGARAEELHGEEAAEVVGRRAGADPVEVGEPELRRPRAPVAAHEHLVRGEVPVQHPHGGPGAVRQGLGHDPAGPGAADARPPVEGGQVGGQRAQLPARVQGGADPCGAEERRSALVQLRQCRARGGGGLEHGPSGSGAGAWAVRGRGAGCEVAVPEPGVVQHVR